jgi:hypothetical protein
MANRTLRKHDKSPPRIATPDETLAYVICFTIYSKEVWPDAKRDGWVSYQIGGDWMHRCPRCGKKR